VSSFRPRLEFECPSLVLGLLIRFELILRMACCCSSQRSLLLRARREVPGHHKGARPLPVPWPGKRQGPSHGAQRGPIYVL
jgi:hypothetical protein